MLYTCYARSQGVPLTVAGNLRNGCQVQGLKRDPPSVIKPRSLKPSGNFIDKRSRVPVHLQSINSRRSRTPDPEYPHTATGPSDHHQAKTISSWLSAPAR